MAIHLNNSRICRAPPFVGGAVLTRRMGKMHRVNAELQTTDRCSEVRSSAFTRSGKSIDSRVCLMSLRSVQLRERFRSSADRVNAELQTTDRYSADVWSSAFRIAAVSKPPSQ